MIAYVCCTVIVDPILKELGGDAVPHVPACPAELNSDSDSDLDSRLLGILII